jgi:hypothetical protein
LDGPSRTATLLPPTRINKSRALSHTRIDIVTQRLKSARACDSKLSARRSWVCSPGVLNRHNSHSRIGEAKMPR